MLLLFLLLLLLLLYLYLYAYKIINTSYKNNHNIRLLTLFVCISQFVLIHLFVVVALSSSSSYCCCVISFNFIFVVDMRFDALISGFSLLSLSHTPKTESISIIY